MRYGITKCAAIHVTKIRVRSLDYTVHAFLLCELVPSKTKTRPAFSEACPISACVCVCVCVSGLHYAVELNFPKTCGSFSKNC